MFACGPDKFTILYISIAQIPSVQRQSHTHYSAENTF